LLIGNKKSLLNDEAGENIIVRRQGFSSIEAKLCHHILFVTKLL